MSEKFRVAIYGEGIFDADTLVEAIKRADNSVADVAEIYHKPWNYYLKGVKHFSGKFKWHESNAKNEELIAC